MSDAEQKEAQAFVTFFTSCNLSQPISDVAELSDGVVFFDILSTIDSTYFRSPTRASSQHSDNWVARFSDLKRLYRLMTQYFAEVLQKPTTGLEVPNLQAVAKDANLSSLLLLCRMTIVIGVQCEKNKDFIEKIQQLGQADQHQLMRAIEQVMSKLDASANVDDAENNSMTEDDHYYRLHSERSQILSEKETLEKVYQELLQQHRALQTNYDDAISEKDDLQARLKASNQEANNRRNEKADIQLRGEYDRVRIDLQKSEDNLSAAELELDRQTNIITDLTKKVDELQGKADEASRLKDQVDELRHAADKLQKTENVMEKYKKKLQEGADLRQHVRSLEKQNAELVDRTASLEEDYRKVAAYKPLVESYKNQIADLEGKGATKTQEMESLKFELSQTKTQLKIARDERARDAETLELYQERVHELELSTNRPTHRRKNTEAEPVKRVPSADDGKLSPPPESIQEYNDDELEVQGLGEELDDAISGTTMTDLKIQVRKLTRELEGMKKTEADASRLIVLENLLEDANRMKSRYEADYLAAHREKLVLQRDIEEIRSGKSMGDGAEAAIALRQRLNETVDQLDALRAEHTELEVRFDTQSKELTIAKSDLNLVNKDQLDILATLRESVNEDKSGLELDMQRLRDQVSELSEKNRMQLEQVNALLLEKVNLQSDGIGQREQMLLRERALGDLRATIAGKDIPEDIRARLLALHEENVALKESNKTSIDKLNKAKQFIKNQDKLFKEQHASRTGGGTGTFAEAEASFQSQIKVVEEELSRQKQLRLDITKRYQREAELMFSALHSIGLSTVRSHLGSTRSSGAQKASWLPMNRDQRSRGLKRT